MAISPQASSTQHGSLRSDFGLSVFQDYANKSRSQFEDTNIESYAQSPKSRNLEQSSTNCSRSTTNASRGLTAECNYQQPEISRTNIKSTLDTTSSPFKCLASSQNSRWPKCENPSQHDSYNASDLSRISSEMALRTSLTADTLAPNKWVFQSALPLSRSMMPEKEENTCIRHYDEAGSVSEKPATYTDLHRRHSTGQGVRPPWTCGHSRSPSSVNQWLDKVEEHPSNLNLPKTNCQNDQSMNFETLPNLRTALEVCNIELPHTMALLQQLGAESSSGTLRRAKTLDGHLTPTGEVNKFSGKARALSSTARQPEDDIPTKTTTSLSEHKFHAPITREKLQRRASRCADPKYEQLMRRLISSRIITQKPLEVKLSAPKVIDDISVDIISNSLGDSRAIESNMAVLGHHKHRRTISHNKNYTRPQIHLGGPIKPVRIPACFSAC